MLMSNEAAGHLAGGHGGGSSAAHRRIVALHREVVGLREEKAKLEVELASLEGVVGFCRGARDAAAADSARSREKLAALE